MDASCQTMARDVRNRRADSRSRSRISSSSEESSQPVRRRCVEMRGRLQREGATLDRRRRHLQREGERTRRKQLDGGTSGRHVENASRICGESPCRVRLKGASIIMLYNKCNLFKGEVRFVTSPSLQQDWPLGIVLWFSSSACGLRVSAADQKDCEDVGLYDSLVWKFFIYRFWIQFHIDSL